MVTKNAVFMRSVAFRKRLNRKKQKEEKEQEQAYPLVPFLFAGMLIGIWIGG